MNVSAYMLCVVALLAGCEPVLLGRARRAAPSICSAGCESDSDCRAEGARCVGAWCVVAADRALCASDLECGLAPSLCAQDADCPEGELCVDPGGGRGRCAFVPDDGIGCDAFGTALARVPSMQAGVGVEVCVDLAATCRQGSCADGCATDAECTRVGALRCDPIRGECGCASDADCIGPGDPRCVEARCVVREAECAP